VKPIVWMSIAAGLLLAADGALSPRPSASDYPAHVAAPGITFAAEAVAPEVARKTLGADVYRAGYVTLEVAVYPDPGNQVNLASGDFTLRAESSSSTMRAATAEVVSAAVYPDAGTRAPETPHKVDVYTGSTVGYGSGGYGRPGGVYTGGGVGVGTGGAGPAGSPPSQPSASRERERNLLEVSLSEKGLPAGKTGHAVAGYLYFPKPNVRGKNTGYQLVWSGGDSTVRLSVPPPGK